MPPPWRCQPGKSKRSASAQLWLLMVPA